MYRTLLAAYFTLATALSPAMCCCIIMGPSVVEPPAGQRNCAQCTKPRGCCTKSVQKEGKPSRPIPCRCVCRVAQPVALIKSGERLDQPGPIDAVNLAAPVVVPVPATIAAAHGCESLPAENVRQRLTRLCMLRC